MSQRVPAFLVLLATLVLAGSLEAGRQAAPSGADLVKRSVAAHGGDHLSSWRTMTITGTIEMDDGITYRAAYRVWAKRPDKLKVEQDMTADRGGRYLYEYFRNGAKAWSRRNLIVGKADPARLERWTNQCLGVAYYAQAATSLTREAEATSDWLTRQGSAYQVTERRPAYVVTATLASGSAKLYIDKATFRLLEESTPEGRRLYSGFRAFEGAVHPTRILEITRGRGGEVITPITWDVIKYGVPIEDWIFEEDMPGKQ